MRLLGVRHRATTYATSTQTVVRVVPSAVRGNFRGESATWQGSHAPQGPTHKATRLQVQRGRTTTQRISAVASTSTPSSTLSETSDRSFRNVLIASEDVQDTNACISWVLNGMTQPGVHMKIHLVHCMSAVKRQPFSLPFNLFPAQHQESSNDPNAPTEEAVKLRYMQEMQQHFGSRLEEAKIAYELHVVQEGEGSGKAAIGSAICRQADQLDCAAVVVASKTRGGLPELFTGSVANYVTHQCSRPVAVLHVPSNAAVNADAFTRNILVAIDDSDQSDISCRWTLNNLYLPGDTIHLMHVVPCLPPITELPPFEGGGLVFGPALPYDLAESEAEGWRRTQAERFKAIMDEAGASHTFDVTAECTQDPATTISEDLCQMASQLKAKAVVCMARKHTQLTELLFNSVTNYVAHHCEQPVVVLHA